MRVNRLAFAVIVLVAFFLPMGVAMASGYWSTSGKVDGKGEKITATGRDPAEIKGWMTFGEVAKGYNVTVEEMADAFSLPRDQVTPDKAINRMESDKFSPAKLRTWLSERKQR